MNQDKRLSRSLAPQTAQWIAIAFAALLALAGCDDSGVYVVKNPKLFLNTVKISVNGTSELYVLEKNTKIARNVWLELDPGDKISILVIDYNYIENIAPVGGYVYARAYLVKRSMNGLELGSEIIATEKVSLRPGINRLPIGENTFTIPKEVTDLYLEIFSYPGAANPEKEEKVGKVIAMIKPSNSSLRHNIARNAFNTIIVLARTKKENEWLKEW